MGFLRGFRNKYLPFLPQGKEIHLLRDRLLRKLRLMRTREPALFFARPELRFSKFLPSLVAEHVFQHGELTFMQIGAYDGMVGDEVIELIKRFPAQGILVEPQPTAYARLTQLHGQNDRLTLVNAAVDRVPGRRKFFVPTEGDVQFASFDLDHVQRHGLKSEQIREIEVDCATVDGLLSQAGWTSLDFLQIDCEGYDYEIIKSVDFDRILPKILRFEYRHFSEPDLRECLNMLGERGYRFITQWLDVIAVLCENSAANELAMSTGARAA